MQSLRNVHISSLAASHIVWICAEALGERVRVCVARNSKMSERESFYIIKYPVASTMCVLSATRRKQEMLPALLDKTHSTALLAVKRYLLLNVFEQGLLFEPIREF